MTQQTTVTTSKRFRLKLNDWTRGLLIAALSTPISIIITSLNDQEFSVNWNFMLRLAVGSGLSYVIKNWASPAKIVIHNAPAATIEAVKDGDKEVKVVNS